jgi:hypothetical protein
MKETITSGWDINQIVPEMRVIYGPLPWQLIERIVSYQLSGDGVHNNGHYEPHYDPHHNIHHDAHYDDGVPCMPGLSVATRRYQLLSNDQKVTLSANVEIVNCDAEGGIMRCPDIFSGTVFHVNNPASSVFKTLMALRVTYTFFDELVDKCAASSCSDRTSVSAFLHRLHAFTLLKPILT